MTKPTHQTARGRPVPVPVPKRGQPVPDSVWERPVPMPIFFHHTGTSRPRAYLFVVLALLLTTPAFAASALELQRHHASGRIAFARVAGGDRLSPLLRSGDGSSPKTNTPAAHARLGAQLPVPAGAEAAARAFLKSHRATLELPDLDTLIPVESRADALGMTHIQFQPHYRGIPVHASAVMVHFAPGLVPETVSLCVPRAFEADTVVRFTEERARALARATYQAEYGAGTAPGAGTARPQPPPPKTLPPPEAPGTSRPRTEQPETPPGVGTAHPQPTGVGTAHPQIPDTGTGRPRSNDGASLDTRILSLRRVLLAPQLLDAPADPRAWSVWHVTVAPENCCEHLPPVSYYIDTATGDLRHRTENVDHALQRVIKDCSGQGVPNPISCPSRLYAAALDYWFGREEGDPPRGPNPRYFPALYDDNDRLYDLYPHVHAYWGTLGIDGANRQGGTGDGGLYPTSITRRYTFADYLAVNAGCPNSGTYIRDGSRLGFCSGAIFPDLVNHEYTHAVVNFSISGGLSQSTEPQAINEGYSNLFGEMAEHFVTGTNDWIGGTGSAWGQYQNMANPYLLVPSQRNPYVSADRHYSALFDCGTGATAPYIRSTVLTKAAYFLVEGGRFNGCTIAAVPRAEVERVWFRALDVYFVSAESFDGVFAKLVQASTDLYGADSDTTAQVRRALQAVELDQPGRCTPKHRRPTPKHRLRRVVKKGTSRPLTAGAGTARPRNSRETKAVPTPPPPAPLRRGHRGRSGRPGR